MSHRPIIALTAGDCTGIGPELVATIVAERRVADDARLLLIGDARVFEEGQRRAGKPFGMRPCLDPSQADWSGEAIPMIDLGNTCLLYTSPSPRDLSTSRMPSSA